MFWWRQQKQNDGFCALKNITLQIVQGETLGIVGRNGAGKSTLLQVISGIILPTSGELYVKGRVATLLELGTGFNPEFTGRENIFIYAAILGLDETEIIRQIDSIIKFADIGEFIDKPIKIYSTGMIARLAFAVACNVEPDILVIDEILAVGDEAFQRKCFFRIKVLQERGTTIIFVSHSAGNVIELCDKAILLHDGQIILANTPKKVIDVYHKLTFAPADKHAKILEEILMMDSTRDGNERKEENSRGNRIIQHVTNLTVDDNIEDYFDPNLVPQYTYEYAQNGAKIENISICDLDGKTKNILTPRNIYIYKYQVKFLRKVFNVRFGMLIKTTTGLELGGISSHPFGEGIDSIEAGQVLTVSFKIQNLLSPGVYFLNAGVLGWEDSKEIFLHRILDGTIIKVADKANSYITGYVDFSTDSMCEIDFK
ncbi:MAG: ABC transporter ATP-binding protein [Candidatus Anammoxibacter sp.]